MSKKRKLVFGVGIPDVDYPTKIYEYKDGKQKLLWWCPYDMRWRAMLKRCYSQSYQNKNPTYKGCIVCDEWILFSNFKRWMEEQYWQDRCLDKDFLFEGNRIYSPSTCIFVPQKVNKFIIARGNDRGDYPLGVNLKKGGKKNPYRSQCKDGSFGKDYLGHFSSPLQAHQAWLMKKLEVCNNYLLEFKDEPLIVKGLTRIKDKIQRHIDTNTELKSF